MNPAPNPRERRDGGFTLVEVVIAAVVFLIILAAVATTGDVATRSMRVSDQRVEQCERMLRFLQRIAPLTRGGVVSTYRVEATDADVTAGRAAAAGEWIDPVDGERRPVIRFRSADGNLAVRANSLTAPISLRFALDPKEATGVVGSDDDGDGLIDEGRVVFSHNGLEVGILTALESCWFTLDGSVLTVELRSARGRASQPAAVRQVYLMRNN